MNSAICVHFVKECLIHYCRALTYLYNFFLTILIRTSGVLKGKRFPRSCFSQWLLRKQYTLNCLPERIRAGR